MALRIFSKMKRLEKNRTHLSFSGALERVGKDEDVVDLSEDLGRLFSITSDNLTINFWPAIIFAAVIVISEWYLHYFCDLLRILVIKRCYVGSLAFI